MPFGLILGAGAVLAAAIAAVTGFGIGSILTPLLALGTGARLAVAAVAIPTSSGACCACGSCVPTSTAGS